MMAFPQLTQRQWKRLFQVFAARLVLEVFGGAGAIWGFSEAVGLRNSSNVSFWRPVALVVGLAFFCRWIMQLCTFTRHESMINNEKMQGQAEDNPFLQGISTGGKHDYSTEIGEMTVTYPEVPV